MAENDNSTRSTTPGILKMVAQICLDAQRQMDRAYERGEQCTFTEAFENALARSGLSQNDLLSVWSLFTLGGRTTKRHLTAMADDRWDTPTVDMGFQPNAH